MTVSDSDHSTQIAGFSTQILDYDELFQRLRAGNTLITANSRLSRVLTGKYNQWRIDQGDSQWPSPEIVSWNLWLEELWETASLQGSSGTDCAVPGSRQLVSLWESTLLNEPLAHNLLRPESLAKQLLETRHLVTNWQLNFKDPAWFYDENENHAAFYYWNKAFDKRCAADNWISPEDRTALLCTALKESRLSIAGNIDFLGFDEFDPSQAELLTSIIGSGIAAYQLIITPQQSKAVLWKSKDGNCELQEMARWARHWLEQEPESAIAIVVPDLQMRRSEIERHLDEILTPGNDDDGSQIKPWNISMGTPLLRVPMIEAAFDLLKLLDYRIDIQDIGRVLRSPWLRAASAERNSRALLEKCLRENYPRQLKPGEIEYRASEIRTHDRQRNELPKDDQEPQAWNSPELAIVLKKLIRFEKTSKGKHPASVWAEMFDQLLVSIGWPLDDETESEVTNDAGAGALSEEHGQNWQAMQAWRDGLRELASLDATESQLSRKQAINQLKQICRETIFQPRTATAPIQVLGLYEVSGLRFDHLWVVGLHNENWPPAAKPNPFIPAKLQRLANIPNSSPQRELEVARTITRRLLETAADCVFSYPGKIDGEEVLPSPLLNLTIMSKDDLPGWQGYNWRRTVEVADGPDIEPLAPPNELKLGMARGGSSILKHQALCPFRAFASNRLGADSLESPADGISPMLHGSLIHSVLEEFWKETKNQAGLLMLDDEDLHSRVRKHVSNVVDEERGLKQRPAFQNVEADRIFRHVMDFLDLDKQRDTFEVVGFEKEIQPVIEGQAIRLVIDRVDRLPSGEEVIIDYKTGKVKPDKWFGDRPEDPQLPLYAISAEETPAAVAFGVVRDDGCLYKGIVSESGILPDLPPRQIKANQLVNDAGEDIPATIEHWRLVLGNLMSDFKAGKASIDPIRGFNSCRDSYCELQSLCRIGELEQFRKAGQKKGTSS